MGPEAFVTVLGVAVIVGALALYLIIIAGILVKVSSNLNRILNEVILDIVRKTGNLGSVVSSIAGDVGNIERSMSSLASAGESRDGDREDETDREDEMDREGYMQEEYVEEEYVEEPASAAGPTEGEDVTARRHRAGTPEEEPRPRRRRRARAARR